MWYISDISKFKNKYPKWKQKYNTKKIIEDMKGKNFIFNLGHGILQHTPVKNLEILIEEIKKSKRN